MREVSDEVIDLINEKGLTAIVEDGGKVLVLQGWGFEIALTRSDTGNTTWYIVDTTGG
jgi:hypothetical protein